MQPRACGGIGFALELVDRQMDPGELWIAAMRAQDLDRAWRLSDQALRERASESQKHSGPRHLQRIWRGEPLDNVRVLVRCYHGLGDTIQFIRFAAPLSRIAREVIVWCQPELHGLLSRIADIDRVLPLHDGTVDASFDVDIEVMELAHALRITAADLAKDVPYLSVSPEPVIPGPDGVRMGVIWRAGDWDSRRSMPRKFLEPLMAMDGVRLYSLQLGADLKGTSIIDWSSPSIETLAARMAAMDMVLTVDTMAAHLAGALGLKTWTLLHSDADWRWGNDMRCAWYPTMHLFRQAEAGDWSAPMRDVESKLREIMVRART